MANHRLTQSTASTARAHALRGLACLGFCAASLALHAAEDSPPAPRALAAPETTVAASWNHAIVYIPGSRHARYPDAVVTSHAYPVVLYMHGCAGITADHDRAWARFLEGLGYIAVLPDSFARADRKSDCNPLKHAGGGFPEAHDMRLQEIDYAMQQLKRCPWADARNIFLMGHSEGGQAAVLSYPEGFRGIILSGTYIYSSGPESDIILAPEDTPILSLVWNRDLWSGATLRPEANTFSKHPESRMVIFPGRGHETYGQPAARSAVAEFLRQNTLP